MRVQVLEDAALFHWAAMIPVTQVPCPKSSVVSVLLATSLKPVTKIEAGRSGWWVAEELEEMPVSMTATVTGERAGQERGNAAQAWGALIWVKGQLGSVKADPQLWLRVPLVK